MQKRAIDIILTLVPVSLFLLLWEFVIATKANRLFFFSSPSRVYQTLVENLFNGVLLTDLWVTGQEAMYGFLIGNVTGCLIGLSLWYSKRFATLARPYIVAIGAIPIFSIAPMMIIWFGTGMYAKVMMAALSTIIVAITQSYEGARQIDEQQLKLFQSFGASRAQMFTMLIVPSSLAWLFNSLKLNISFALLGAFIAEFISSEEGLGHRILKAGGTYNVAMVLAAVICIIALAMFFSGIIRLAEKYWMKWK